MKKTLFSISGLVLLLVFFLAAIILNDTLVRGLRLDFTEDKLYTLTDGTKSILQSIDEPLNLYFFYSKNLAKNDPGLKNYAKRVKELLDEYVEIADGKIKLIVIEPEPFSEAEDQAVTFGLDPITMPQGDFYFGLVGTNTLDSKQTLSFLNIPAKFLEYELSKLVDNLNHSKRPTVGVISGLNIMGGFDPAQGGTLPPWVLLDHIQQIYDVQMLEDDIDQIDENIDVLMVVQPSKADEKLLFAIDQFILQGGKAIFFIDPYPELAPPYGYPGAPLPASELIQQFSKLFTNWGVSTEHVLVGDADLGLSLPMEQGQEPIKHIYLLELGAEQMSPDDAIISSVDNILLSSVGYLQKIDDATSDVTSLMTSSEQTTLIIPSRLQNSYDPRGLLRDFTPENKAFNFAVRITGPILTAFPDGRKGFENPLKNSETSNIIIIADTDILSDRLWVDIVQNQGISYAVPMSGNGNFVINAIDSLVGSNNLMNIRSRHRFQRGFDLVDELQSKAQNKLYAKEQELLQQKQETEQQLRELENQKQQQNLLVLSPEEEAAVENFLQQILEINKQLRDVKFNLNKDINALDRNLKIINILGVPLLLTIIALVIFVMRVRRQNKLYD